MTHNTNNHNENQTLPNEWQKSQESGQSLINEPTTGLALATANKTQNTEQGNHSCSKSVLSAKTIRQLFQKMTFIYGHKWISIMGDPVDTSGELSVSAKTWQSGLTGITPQQLAKGMERATLSNSTWCPSLQEFRAMCFKRDDVPCVQDIVKILINEPYTAGNVVERYQHSLAYAIARHKQFSVFSFRMSSEEKSEKMVSKIYDDLMVTGWDDFLPEHYEKPIAIESKKSSPEFAAECLAKIKENLKESIEQEEKQRVIDRVNRIMGIKQ